MTEHNERLARVLENELSGRGLSIAVAEQKDGTGGSVIDALTISGATRVIHFGSIFSDQPPKFPRADFTITTRSENRSKVDSTYTLTDRKPQTTVFTVRQLPRREAKMAVTEEILSSALLYLHGYHMNPRGIPLVSNPMSEHQDEYVEMQRKATNLISELKRREMHLETIESCTAGSLANAITDVEGSSETFVRGWLAYDENVKMNLGVHLKDLAFGNVYSEHVAASMAHAVYNRSHNNLVIATTGLMDTLDTRPYHNHTKPGTIYVAILVNGIPYTTTITSPVSSREKMKLEVSADVFSFAYHAILKATKRAWYVPYERF